MPAERSGPEPSPSPGEGPRPPSGVRASEPSAATALTSEELSAVLAAFRRISEAVTRPAESERLFRTIAEEAATLLAPASAITCTLEPEGDLLRTRVGTGALARHEGEHLPLEGSLAGRAVLTGEPQRTPDVASDPDVFRPRERCLPAGPGLAVPLRAAGRAVGALLVVRQAGAPAFDERDAHRLLQVAEVAGSAVGNAWEFDRVRGSRAEVEDWRREREMRAWIARYAEAARETRTAVFEWDPASGRLAWGDSLEAVVGYPPGEYALTLDALLERAHPEDRERARAEVERTRPGEGLRTRLRLHHRNGTYRLFLLHLRPAEAPPLGRATVTAVIEDATDEGWSVARERSADAEAPARQVIRALRHEINNPLAVILGQVQLLGRESIVQNDPVLQHSIGTIHEEGQRILEMTRRLAAMEQSGRLPEINEQGGFALPQE